MPIDRGRTIISRNPEITAYEIAVAEGFVGTREDWLASLVLHPTYAVYTALISQIGTNAPTVVVLENTLSAAIVWTRIDSGIYNGTLTGEFLANKTFPIIDNSGPLTPLPLSLDVYHRRIGVISDNIVQILTGDDTSYSDGILELTPIEIRVYP